jgi:hypothetical protein
MVLLWWIRLILLTYGRIFFPSSFTIEKIGFLGKIISTLTLNWSTEWWGLQFQGQAMKNKLCGMNKNAPNEAGFQTIQWLNIHRSSTNLVLKLVVKELNFEQWNKCLVSTVITENKQNT